MDTINKVIWGRNFELKINYDCYKNETILNSQIESVQLFIQDNVELESSLEYIKKFCLLNDGSNIKESSITNIFKYVMPKYLYVKRDEKKHIFALMCDYKFDIEHGIGIIFEEGKFINVVKQDYIL